MRSQSAGKHVETGRENEPGPSGQAESPPGHGRARPPCPQAALLCLLPLSPSQQPLNLLISKPRNKRRSSIGSLPQDTLSVLVGAGDWGQGEQGLKNAGIWGMNPTGSTQSTHPCWDRSAVHNVPMRRPGDTKGAEAWKPSWGQADDVPLISCTHLGSAGALQHHPWITTTGSSPCKCHQTCDHMGITTHPATTKINHLHGHK